MLSRRLVLAKLFLLGFMGASCTANPPSKVNKLIVGLVSYDGGSHSLEKYDKFKYYLEQKTKALVELEPAFNEIKAVEEVERGIWSIVFAPPGLAAIAIARGKYTPVFRLEGANNVRSIVIVNNDSSIQSLEELSNKVVALGQVGSATGYYLPLYDLYGLTLSEVRFAPTPRAVLDWLSRKTIDAGALSVSEFEFYRGQFDRDKFRILHQTRYIPPGVVLLSPNLERLDRQQIVSAMKEAPPNIVGDAGYIVDANVPNYEQFIQIVEKIRPLETKVRQKPAVLTGNKIAVEL